MGHYPGKDFYTLLLTTPDKAFTNPEITDCECEELTHSINEVYESLSGGEMPENNIRDPKEPLGKKWEENDLEDLFPQTASIYNN